jgi:hypothetical protein
MAEETIDLFVEGFEEYKQTVVIQDPEPTDPWELAEWRRARADRARASAPEPTDPWELAEWRKARTRTSAPKETAEIAENISAGSSLKENTDGSTDMSSLKGASEGSGSNCLGEVKEHLRSITGVPGKIKDMFDDIPGLGSKLGNLIKDNIRRAKDKAIEATEDGIEYIEDKVKDVINSLKNAAFGTLIKSGTITSSIFGFVQSIGDQLKRHICDTKFIFGMAVLLVSLSRNIKNKTNNMSNADLKSLLEGDITDEELALFTTKGVIADLYAELNKELEDNRYQLVKRPTALTYTEFESLPDILTDTKNNDIGSSAYGGLWDPGDLGDTPTEFYITGGVVIDGDDYENLTKSEYGELVQAQYDVLYNRIDFDNPTTLNLIDTPAEIKKLKEGDVLVALGIEGNNGVGSSENTRTATLSVSYVVYQREENKIRCETKMKTSIIDSYSARYYGISSNSDDNEARLNAFKECTNDAVLNITNE